MIMTDKEIKLELAKAALKNNAFHDTTELHEGIKSLYDWITEEPDVVADDKYDDSVIRIVDYINSKGRSGGYGARINLMFDRCNIKTVQQLLEFGRRNFGDVRSIGNGALRRIDDALEELYGITTW